MTEFKHLAQHSNDIYHMNHINPMNSSVGSNILPNINVEVHG
ncbi:hypothetical protein PAECIP112173_03288 [Paenibacillus sp. JJ-100]|nr:hypothetical protein [Paenibacillus sp. JJ-100]CAI6081679.1 hypothetical protein PAECIP112173_03288 [Paenibacillus sp. JJ-100]